MVGCRRRYSRSTASGHGPVRGRHRKRSLQDGGSHRDDGHSEARDSRKPRRLVRPHSYWCEIDPSCFIRHTPDPMIRATLDRMQHVDQVNRQLDALGDDHIGFRMRSLPGKPVSIVGARPFTSVRLLLSVCGNGLALLSREERTDIRPSCVTYTDTKEWTSTQRSSQRRRFRHPLATPSSLWPTTDRLD